MIWLSMVKVQTGSGDFIIGCCSDVSRMSAFLLLVMLYSSYTLTISLKQYKNGV